MALKKSTPAREQVVLDEAHGFGHAERMPAEQVKRLSDGTPAWATRCRATRTTTDTNTEGSGQR